MENVSSRCGKSDNAPRLRFPEFRGEWIEKKLGEISERITRKNRNNETDLPLTISSKDGLVDQITYFNKTVASKDMSGYYLLKNGEFAYNKSYSVGYDFGSIKRLDKYPIGALSTLYICFSIKNFDSDFMKVYFDSLKWYREIYLIAAEGARNHGLLNISTEDFFETKHKLPVGLPEQKKIAAFFTLLDRRIQKQRQLVEFLKTYKRGVSEAIFERRLNFSSLLATEWKKYKLGQIGEFYNGLSGKSREDFGNGNCKFITYMNVYKNIIADESLCESVKIRKEEEQNSVKYGDVLFTQSSETLEEVGYTSVWTHSSQPYLNSFCFGYRFYDSVMTNPIFIAHYMRSNYIRKAIMKEGQGATRVNLSAERLKNLNIFLPDIKGQNKIAEFLSGLEDRIHKEESVLENMTMEKSSLLQKMFI